MSTRDYITTHPGLLSIYMTSEYPEKGDTKRTLRALQSAGVGMIEVGMPFSDPLADGPVIQESSMKAIANGFELEGFFADLHDIREEVDIPLVPMGYFNAVLSYGLEDFLKQCRSLHIDTVIIPDMPMERYEQVYHRAFNEYGVHPVFLISPKTSEDRIRRIDALSGSFIYVVADNSITGAKEGFSAAQKEYFTRIRAMGLKSPLIIGFGISDKATFDSACKFADGAIIGSAFIKAVGREGELKEKVMGFVDGILR